MQKFDEMTIREYNDLLSSRAPTPGGGSALCQVGALACSLIEMALNITTARLSEKEENYIYLSAQRETVARAKRALYRLSDEDAAAFQYIADTLKMSKTTIEEKKLRNAELQKAYHRAALVPLDVMGLCCELLTIAEVRVMYLLSKYVASDCTIAADLLRSVVRGSALNVRANTALITDADLAASLNGKCALFESRTVKP